MNDDRSKDVSSFITLALSQSDKSQSALSTERAKSVKPLLARYNHIKDSFPNVGNINGFDIPDDNPDPIYLDNVDQNDSVKSVKISQGQLDIAKAVGERVSEIDFLYKTGKPSAADEKYANLMDYLDDERETLYGDFQSIGEIEELIASNAIGANGDPTASVIGVIVVYVGVEIYAMS